MSFFECLCAHLYTFITKYMMVFFLSGPEYIFSFMELYESMTIDGDMTVSGVTSKQQMHGQIE